MYVYWEAPAEIRQPYPIVLVHGGGGQGLDFMTTPDGRPGWVQLLVDRGWLVYVVDRPAHGRSPYIPDVMGEPGPPLPPPVLRTIFGLDTGDPALAGLVAAHTQWPGSVTDPDDAAFLQFAAAGGPFAGDAAARQSLERDRLVELLELTGPAVLMGNSLGGPCSFLVADSRPDLVAALVQLEPAGPAFATTFGPDTLQWGCAGAPLRYDPPATSPAELDLVEVDGTVLQSQPARTLPHLAEVPIVVVTSEASVFADSDPRLVAYLQQAGCDATHLSLPAHGARGNSHGVMFERNHEQVLDIVLGWVQQHLP
jgi:pimeloyl-ACP methyl ester carboxylesterase